VFVNSKTRVGSMAAADTQSRQERGVTEGPVSGHSGLHPVR